MQRKKLISKTLTTAVMLALYIGGGTTIHNFCTGVY